MTDASVIISTRDRAEILGETLEHLTQQRTCDLVWELIVVDNGSSDQTQSILTDYVDRLPLKMLYVEEPGKNIALNKAVKIALGKLLIFTDDDVIPAEQWISELVAAARRWPDDVVFGGPVEHVFPEVTPPWIMDPSFLKVSPAFRKYQPLQTEGRTCRPPFGANLAIRTEVFEETSYCETIGPQGKNYAMGSEAELLKRLRAQGVDFIFVPHACVQHVIEDYQVEEAWLLRRAYRAGRGGARQKCDHPDLRILDVPWTIWPRFIVATLGYTIGRFRGQPARCIAGVKFHKLRGRVEEHRAIAQTRRLSQNEASGSLSVAGPPPTSVKTNTEYTRS